MRKCWDFRVMRCHIITEYHVLFAILVVVCVFVSFHACLDIDEFNEMEGRLICETKGALNHTYVQRSLILCDGTLDNMNTSRYFGLNFLKVLRYEHSSIPCRS
jgi:hypothetical protein